MLSFKLNESILVASLLLALAPDMAAACPSPERPACQALDFWFDLVPTNAALIPADGVLVLRGMHHGGADEPWLDKIQIEVTRNGEAVAGALETTAQQGVLIWRPAAPWEPGAPYAVKGSLANPPIDPACFLGGSEEVLFAADITIGAMNGAALGATQFTGTIQVETVPEVALATVACCPGVLPEYYDASGCGDYGVFWEEGACAPTVTHGTLTVQITGEPAAKGPAGDQLLYRLKVDGEVHSSGAAPAFAVVTEAPFCAVIEAEDLAGGKITTSEEHCFGQDVAGELGVFPLDPSAAFDCELQQCAVLDNTWDPGQCTPFVPAVAPTSSDTRTDASDGSDGSGSSDSGANQGGDAQGCACDARSTGDAGLLALVGLLGLARRRRAR